LNTVNLVGEKMGKIKLGKILLVCILLTATAIAFAQETELKYDDGTMEKGLSIGGSDSRGHAVKFSPLDMPWTINKVKIYGARKGSGEFSLEIWDKDLNTIYSSTFPYSKFGTTPNWTEIGVQNVKVAGEFYIVLITNSTKDNGGLC